MLKNITRYFILEWTANSVVQQIQYIYGIKTRFIVWQTYKDTMENGDIVRIQHVVSASICFR